MALANRILNLIVFQVPPPATTKPTEAEFFTRDATGDLKPNPPFLKQHFFHEGRLTEEQALFILERATELLRTEENVVNVQSPVTSDFLSNISRVSFAQCFAVCGDIHGQYVS